MKTIVEIHSLTPIPILADFCKERWLTSESTAVTCSNSSGVTRENWRLLG